MCDLYAKVDQRRQGRTDASKWKNLRWREERESLSREEVVWDGRIKQTNEVSDAKTQRQLEF